MYTFDLLFGSSRFRKHPVYVRQKIQLLYERRRKIKTTREKEEKVLVTRVTKKGG